MSAVVHHSERHAVIHLRNLRKLAARLHRHAPALPLRTLAGSVSSTAAVLGYRSSGALIAGTAAVASTFPALSRSTTFDAGASTEPRLCTVTFTRLPSTLTSSSPMPRSGRDQYGTPFATSFNSMTVVTCGGNVISRSRLRSNSSVRVLTSRNGAVGRSTLHTLRDLPLAGIDLPSSHLRLHRNRSRGCKR